MSQAHQPMVGSSTEQLSGGWTGGVRGNERLTALTGILLLSLLVVEGITVLGVRQMFTIHTFVGLLLIPPVLLKVTSTGYRFVRYYTGSRAYRAAGPPAPLLRLIGPFIALSTAGLFGTGVVLLLLGPAGNHPWRPLHAFFFLVWFFLMTVHVLTYVWRLPGLAREDFQLAADPAARGLRLGSLTRQGLVAGSFVLGLAIAIAALPWDASWLHWFSRFGPER